MTKTAVVTGATSGIGLCTARLLVEAGYAVIALGRNEARTEAAAGSIEAATGRKADFMLGDLSTTAGCRAIAQEIRTRLGAAGGGLGLLFHVAGTVSSWHECTAEGFELQFAVNHLAPFLLTRELLPLLMKAEDSRVLVVSSESHRHARIRWEDPMMRRRYNILAAYKQSKLCNVLFARELSRRLPPGSPITTCAIDPGLARTDIGLKGSYGLHRLVWRLRQLSGTDPEVPARHMVRVATDAATAGHSGLYWRAGRPLRPDRRALDPGAASRLWELSERLCGIEGRYFQG